MWLIKYTNYLLGLFIDKYRIFIKYFSMIVFIIIIFSILISSYNYFVRLNDLKLEIKKDKLRFYNLHNPPHKSEKIDPDLPKMKKIDRVNKFTSPKGEDFKNIVYTEHDPQSIPFTPPVGDSNYKDVNDGKWQEPPKGEVIKPTSVNVNIKSNNSKKTSIVTDKDVVINGNNVHIHTEINKVD